MQLLIVTVLALGVCTHSLRFNVNPVRSAKLSAGFIQVTSKPNRSPKVAPLQASLSAVNLAKGILLPSSLGFWKREYGVSYGYGGSIAAAAYLAFNASPVGSFARMHSLIHLVYGVRLVLFLGLREATVPYFKEMKERIEQSAPSTRMQRLPYILQCAALYWWMSMPLLITSAAGAPKAVTKATWYALYAAATGLGLEVLGDTQKYISKTFFKQGLVTGGLFGLLRHPNYTGEMLLWTMSTLVGLLTASQYTTKTLLLGGLCVGSLLGATGIVFVLMMATIGLDRRQMERYGNSDAYKSWKAWSGPTLNMSKKSGGSSSDMLDFLEADPYYDQSNIPLSTFKAKEPHIGKIVSVKRIVGAQATGETCDVVIDHAGKMPYWEGQSYGVIPPGINPKNNKPNTNRLYSIASTRYGDDMKGTTTTLCVRRATYWCPELKAEDPTKKGICSNYLCDSKPGDEIKLTGPVGKVMLMPESKPDTDLIMVATGTGIAPYRSFIRRLFVEKTPAAAAYKGLAWLFLGVANTDALLYDADWQKIAKEYPNNFKVDYALSREQTNTKGGKMYIQDKVEEYAEDIFNRMDNGAHMYFCGLKGMMPGILEMMEGVAKGKGKEWKEVLKHWKENGQWHVEVY